MNMLQLWKSLSAALLLVLFCSAPALAANVTVTATGDRSYSIYGSGMDGVAGIQLDIMYDSDSLSSPVVTKGEAVSGAILAANTTSLGSIRIAIISSVTFSGNGQIAIISFNRRPGGSGGITSVSVKSMINSKGEDVPATAANVSGSSDSFIQQEDHSSQQNQTSQSNQLNSGATTSSGTLTSNQLSSGITTSLGTVTFASDMQQRVGSESVPPKTAPVSISEPTDRRIAKEVQPLIEPSVEVKAEETSQYVVYKGILDRFKLHDGSKKFVAVEALFDKKTAQTIRQNPAILISNGQDKALLTIDVPVRIKSSPNFAVHGGTIVSFQQDKQQQGRWLVDVLPETGSLKVTVTIITGAEEFEYPLTVAPPVKTELTLDEKGWDRFIAETGTKKVPLHDFNNDGVRNYIDEYIFAANIIAKKTTQERPAPAPRLPAATPQKTGK